MTSADKQFKIIYSRICCAESEVQKISSERDKKKKFSREKFKFLRELLSEAGYALRKLNKITKHGKR